MQHHDSSVYGNGIASAGTSIKDYVMRFLEILLLAYSLGMAQDTDAINDSLRVETPGGNYYQEVINSDSTVSIEWGNKHFENRDIMLGQSPLWVGRTNFQNESDKYIAFNLSTGTDTWDLYILPLHKGAKAINYGNYLDFDLKNEIVIYEYCQHMSDWSKPETVMMVENFRNNKRMPIMETCECASAINHYCIDSFAYSNNKLEFCWITPLAPPFAKDTATIKHEQFIIDLK